MEKVTKKAMIFAAHPEAKGFHFTSDGQAFTLENDAVNYAKTLKDTTVEFEKRPKGEAEAKSTKVESGKPKAESEKVIEVAPSEAAKKGTMAEKQAEAKKQVSEIATKTAKAIEKDAEVKTK